MDDFMQAAIAEAQAGLADGGMPIGSVLTHRGVIIGRDPKRRAQQGSATLHGEMDALKRLCSHQLLIDQGCTAKVRKSAGFEAMRGIATCLVPRMAATRHIAVVNQ